MAGTEVDGGEVDGDRESVSGGGVSTASDGTDVSVGADVTVDPEVGGPDDVVTEGDVSEVDVSEDEASEDDVVSDVVASTTGTGSHVSGEDGSTGSGSPGGSVAAGSCSTTL